VEEALACVAQGMGENTATMTSKSVDALLAGVSAPGLGSDAEVAIAARLFSSLRSEVTTLEGTHLSALEALHEWGLLHEMYERAAAHVGGCIVLFSNGHIAPAEALCRTAVESAVNLYYCSLGDSIDLLMSYFKSYVETERKQNTVWAKSVRDSNMPKEAKDFHLTQAQNKQEALAIYDQKLNELFGQIGRSYANANGVWPSIFERFKAINHEVSYRTVYAALCSQAHNDPEDLLNNFLQGAMQVQGAEEKLLEENRNFSLHMVFMAIHIFIEASAMYIARFGISVERLMGIHREATAAALRIASRIHPDEAHI
jgi:hypothetical protein